MSPKHIVCAFAESASGPGWANSPIWFVTRDGNGKLAIECLQPAEQTAEMRTLYTVSSAAHACMTRAVERLFEKKGNLGRMR